MKIKFSDFGRCLICCKNPCECPEKEKPFVEPEDLPKIPDGIEIGKLKKGRKDLGGHHKYKR